MEEFEILDFHELQVEKQGLDQASKFLQKKIQNGFKVSIVIKKQHNFALPPLQQKKNDLFSKHHQPVDLVSQSSELTENNDKHGSSTSSNQSIKIAKNQIISPTPNETPEQHPNEQISQQSEDEEVSFHKSKANSFELLLKNDLLNQKLRTSLQFLRDGKFKLALERMMEVYKEGNEKLKQQAEKLQISAITLVCVQSLCYATQILKELGQINEALKCLDKCLNQFEINDFDKRQIYIYSITNIYNRLITIEKHQTIMNKSIGSQTLPSYQLRYLLSMLYYMIVQMPKRFAMKDSESYKINQIIQIPGYFILITLQVASIIQKKSMTLLSSTWNNRRKDQSNQKHEQLYKIMNLQGVIYHLQGSSINAIEVYEQLVAYCGDTESIGLALIMNNLALAYLDRMKFKSANLLFAKAVTILKSYFNENHPAVQRIEKNKMLVASATLSYI
ncbi:unnamed protein product [Paramecium octaurelia]|uniref:Tetratricopeptide repeat protein n=1 Tax=Paramecium octaurelia TaxID=43137 RepID=A0A8S1W5Z2_PAROT|nr:unnamed protein product [Paramecium octaurelia]